MCGLFEQPSPIITLHALRLQLFFNPTALPPLAPRRYPTLPSLYADECAHLWNILLSSLYLLVVVAFAMLLMRNNVCGKIRFVYFTNDWFRLLPLPFHDPPPSSMDRRPIRAAVTCPRFILCSLKINYRRLFGLSVRCHLFLGFTTFVNILSKFPAAAPSPRGP